MRRDGSASSMQNTTPSASGLSLAIPCAPIPMAMRRKNTSGSPKISPITRHSPALTKSPCWNPTGSQAQRPPSYSLPLPQRTVQPYGRAARQKQIPSPPLKPTPAIPSSDLARICSATRRRTCSQAFTQPPAMSTSTRQGIPCGCKQRTPSATRRGSMRAKGKTSSWMPML